MSATKRITKEKLEQAGALVAASGLDVWLTFVRETSGGGDPVLPLILDGGLTWQSALIVTQDGQRIAIVGNYDAPPLLASGEWDDVIPYVQSIRQPLLAVLERVVKNSPARIGVNISTHDVKADGLTHGMFLLLEEYLAGTHFAGCLVSAEDVVIALRAQKTLAEVTRMEAAIAETETLFDEIGAFAVIGMTERAIYDFVHDQIEKRHLGYAWDPTGNPMVNSGPDSMLGHGIPSETITLAPGHVFHLDLGVVKDDYSSDIQRCWYIPHPGETTIPEDVQKATLAVTDAISAGAERLRPGVLGWEVDAAARKFLVEAGYPEYQHALGHQVGRVAHDGGSILGPRWERYGRTPFMPIQAGEVYTLELGVLVEGCGYLGLEEMVQVTETGCRWLSQRQMALPLLASSHLSHL